MICALHSHGDYVLAPNVHHMQTNSSPCATQTECNVSLAPNMPCITLLMTIIGVSLSEPHINGKAAHKLYMMVSLQKLYNYKE